MEKDLDGPELLRMAVRESRLTQAQLDDCVAESGRAGGGATPVSVALAKGWLTESSLAELRARLAEELAVPTVRDSAVRMVCSACGQRFAIPYQEVRGEFRCTACSGALAVESPSPGAPSTGVQTPSWATPSTYSRTPSKLPDDVEKQAADPRNRIGKYVLMKLLGKGGMGEVYHAFDSVMHRFVAIKIPRAIGEEEIRRLYIEAQGAGRLSHPNIAGVYEVAETDGRHYIAMQYIHGTTVEQRIQKNRVRDAREIARWVRDAALAVHFANQNGVIHRDLKPANIMIDGEDRIFVMDFGLAKVQSDGGGGTVSGMILGTPAYMPPEQANGRQNLVDTCSDCYALGATLYALVTGRRPYLGDQMVDVLVQVVQSDPPAPRSLDPKIPQELEAIILKAMTKDRHYRYATPKDLADELDRFLKGEPIKAKRSTITQRARKAIVRHRSNAVAGIALLLAGVVGILLVRSGGGNPAPPPKPPADPAAAWRPLFATLKKAVAADSFDPAAAKRLLDRAAREFPGEKADVDEFLASERRVVTTWLEGLARNRWIERRDAVARYRAWLAFLGAPTAAADAMLAWRGTCTIRLHVLPWAELDGVMAGALPREDRFTPCILKDVEIAGDYIELRHESAGSFRIPTDRFADGRAYSVEGTLPAIEVTEDK